MNARLAVLLLCVFAAMLGFGVTLPVLAFYVDRLALEEGQGPERAFLHVGFITGIFPLAQVALAPVWGRLSDRVGRRPVLLAGLTGTAVAQVFFGLASTLQLLYVARVLGGVFSAAILPIATAYVTDVTGARERGRAMAWVGSAAGLGVAVGPALGAFVSQIEWVRPWSVGSLTLDEFSLPFIAAALVIGLVAAAAARWLVETRATPGSPVAAAGSTARRGAAWPSGSMWRLLAYSFVGQFGLALFEGTFALHASRELGFGPVEMAVVFATCGLVMAVTQGTVVAWLFGRVGEHALLQVGFVLMGIGLALIMLKQTLLVLVVDVGVFALGSAMVTPSLAALVSGRAGDHAGRAFGLQGAANGLGQAIGPVLGAALLIWNVHAPYLIAAVLLGGAAVTQRRQLDQR